MKFFVGVIVLGLLSHWLLGRWMIASFPRLQRRRREVYVLLFTLALMPSILRVLTRFTWSPLVTNTLAASIIELMVVMFGVAPMGVFYIVRRFLDRRAKKRATALAKKDAPKKAEPAKEEEADDEKPPQAKPTVTISRRQMVERLAGAASYGVMGSVLGWGLVRGRHAFELEEVVVKIPGLPKALDGYVICQVSDIHAGAFVQERELDEGFELVRRLKPDLLVCTGDIVDFEAGWTPLFARRFADLPTRDGRFAILGNHDYYAETARVRQMLADANIRVLLNEGLVIRPQDGGGFALLGVDDMWAPNIGGVGPDLARTIAQVPQDLPRILLAHQPAYFDIAAGQVALQLSGHTHGGQINPGFSPAGMIMKYIVGRYDRNGTTMWVNRGFGVAGPPARIGAPPEVTKVVLVSA